MEPFTTDLDNYDSPDAFLDEFQGKAQDSEELLPRHNGKPIISLDPTVKLLPGVPASPLQLSPVSILSLSSEEDSDEDEDEDEDERNTPGSPMEQNAYIGDLTVPDLLQKGTAMVMVSASQEKDVVFKLDPGKCRIVWDSKGRRASTSPLGVTIQFSKYYFVQSTHRENREAAFGFRSPIL
jgi:hypothetical protein